MDDIKQRLLWCTADLPLYEMPNGEWVPDENAVHDLAAAALARIEELERENVELRDGADQDSRFILAYQQICREHGFEPSFQTVLENIPENARLAPKNQLNQ